MKKIKILCAALIAAALVLGACGSSPKTTAPDELDIKLREASDYLNERIPQGRKVAVINIQSDSSALSEYIIDELISNAVNDGTFAVVDRQQLDAARAELNFNMSGEVSDQSAQSIGQMLGAQTIVTGRVSRIGDSYRLSIRALETETVQVQGSKNLDIAAGARINALIASGGTASTGGTAVRPAASTGSTTQSGGQAQQTTPAASSAIANGTYTFWPRPQAFEKGVETSTYLNKIVVRGGYFTVYLSNKAVGRTGGFPPVAGRWNYRDEVILQDLDNPRRTWNLVNHGFRDEETNDEFITFEGVTGRRFSLNESYYGIRFDEIILPDQPDE